MSQTIFGIDFGTTNSCLALLEPTGPRVIEIDGQTIVPSVVSFDPESGEVVVGQRARNRLMLRPEETVRSIKRLMGSDESLVIAGQSLRPDEIAAEILRYLKVEGEKTLEQEIRRVVITVPAFFEDAQRRATIHAGELAGLEVVRIINEPTAAALLYGRLERSGSADRKTKDDQQVLVYDLGGGTFDVSIVHISGEINEVLASCGDNQLGGDDFDRLLREHLRSLLSLDDGKELSLSARTRLNDAAEKAKIDLSQQPFVRVTEEALVGGQHLDEEIARHTFDELVEGMLDGTLEKVEEALSEARLEPEEIDRVILVGGSTAIPRVQDMLTQHFECPVEHSFDPSLCVALGAAIQGGILEGKIFDHILIDVAPHSLGVKVIGEEDYFANLRSRTGGADTFAVLIRRNTQIPTSYSEVFYTVSNNQKQILVEVFQGENPRCSDNTLIGEFSFELRPAPADCEVITDLSYDLDGVVRVRVEQRGFDNRQEVTMDSRQVSDESATEPTSMVGGAAVDNYILRKARALAEGLPAGKLRDRIELEAEAYEVALGSDAEDEVDAAEDTLLETLELAEEQKQETSSVPSKIDNK